MPANVFTRKLMRWHFSANKREMPWKGEKDPYKIWLSEIILQQTRVEQGWNYYERFVSHYPTIFSLAKAKDDAVFKLWEGLGYYNRCRNLLFTARFIANTRNGIFPETYNEILELKGIGPYTAAAISSFAFNLPYPVVDGNVYRVLARYFGIDTPIDSSEGKKQFNKIASEVLDKKYPGSFNQAIMDFGATVCKPFMPLCNKCPLGKNCISFRKGIVNHLPVKEKTMLRKKRWFTYFIFQVNKNFLINKRSGNDIWQGLNEFYLLETEEKREWNTNAVNEWLDFQFAVKNAMIKFISEFFSQQLTHQQISGQFIRISLPEIPKMLQSYQWLERKEIEELPFPKFINQFMQTRYFQ